MQNFTIIIFLLAVLLSLYALIDKLKLPQPVLLVLVGLLIGFIPYFPNLVLDPEIIFLVVLPPLLFDAASHTSWMEFKTNFRQITTLGISLVFFTTLAVAVTAYYLIAEFSWPLAFLLGAIVSPPDAVASSGVIKGLGLNKRVISILEGESLINDASALIAYRYALAACITGSFVFWKAGLQFLWIAGGGISIGLLLGYVLILLHKKIDNYPVVETGLSLLTPFLSYLAAEQLHCSGILAVVSTGIIISWRSQEIFSYETRMQSRIVWDTLIFLMNGFIFILMGLQLPGILKQLSAYSLSQLIVYSLVISFATILVRILWVFISASASTLTKKFQRQKKSTTPQDATNNNFWKNVLVVSWTGTRGMVSMATALALPLTLSDNKVFGQRELIIFLCFVVIFITLVVQGLSLPLLIRWLKIKKTENPDQEEKELQLSISHSTLHFIKHDYPELDESLRKKLVEKYEAEEKRLVSEIHIQVVNDKEEKQLTVTISPLQEALMAIKRFQRELLLQLRKEGDFSDTAIREVERDMDIDELKLNQSLPKTE